MRTASDFAQEIESLSDDLGELKWAKVAAIRTEVRTQLLTDELIRELYELEFTYESRHDGDYLEDEVDLAVKAGLDPTAHLAWLLKRANQCAEIAHFLRQSADVRTR